MMREVNFFSKCYLFIYLWLLWVFDVARGLSLLVATLCCMCRLLAMAASLVKYGSRVHRLQQLSRMCSVVAAQRLRCYEVMWDLPGPGIEPVSSALQGRFLTTRPPGKSEVSEICKVKHAVTRSVQVHTQFLQVGSTTEFASEVMWVP